MLRIAFPSFIALSLLLRIICPLSLAAQLKESEPQVSEHPELMVQLGHSLYTKLAALTTDGKLAVTCGNDPTPRLWDLATGKELRRLKGHRGNVIFLTLSGDGKLALTGDDDGIARLWDLASGKEVRRLDGHKHVDSVALTADGNAHIDMRWFHQERYPMGPHHRQRNPAIRRAGGPGL